MIIKTSDPTGTKPFIQKLNFPKPDSHKGQNGKLLIIGGSGLFHAASLWSAAIASRIVDMVHYASTEENNRIFLNLKTKFVDGIVVNRQNITTYAEEDNCILVGPGMTRGKISQKSKIKSQKFSEILQITDEPTFTYALTYFMIHHFPHKKFVFDAGALQMMEKNWLTKLKEKPILTPHQFEFTKLFGVKLNNLSTAQKKTTVQTTAKKYHCVILLKTMVDIVSDGTRTIEIHGGNAGLTKGGTGDVLAGLVAGSATVNNSFNSAVVASFLVKKASEDLFAKNRFWYNATDLVFQIPKTMKILCL